MAFSFQSVEFSMDEIKRELRPFGPIENIETINESETTVEAYVLYEQSQSAFQAFMANRNGIISTPELQQIIPADTWHQPDSYDSLWNTIDPEKCAMMELNDDCLLEIFKYLDLDALVNMANVCTRFHHLLDNFFFRKVKMHTVFVVHASLSILRQTMKCIGPHLVHLCLRYQNHGATSGNYLYLEHVERATYKIVQNIGENLKNLTIRMPQGQKPFSKLFELLIPILRKITFLEWDAEFDCGTIERLRDLCPNLETLVLKKRIFTCHNNHEVVDLYFPTLRWVETFQYMSALNLPCQRFFERFIQSNPQLIRLKLTNVNDDLFKIVAQYSKNLEYLEMLQNFDLCGIHYEPTLYLLSNLEHLKVFVIRVKTTEFLSEVENQIKCLSEMKQLELIVLLRNYSPPIWPPERFPFAHHFSDILIESNRMKLRIGDNATTIDFPTGKTTLVNIINSNNPKESSHPTLKRDIRSIFKLSKRYFPECQQKITFENSDCYQFIRVSNTL